MGHLWLAPAALAIAAFALAAPASRARAGDAAIELTTGGLVFTVPRDVEMRTQDLFISADEIRVRYVFFNRGKADAATLAVFPLPDLDARAPSFGDSVLPVEEQANFLGFRTLVDGKPVAMQIEQSAFGVGLDRTDRLKQAGIPLNPALQTTVAALARLSPAALDELRVAGLIDFDEEIAIDGKPPRLEPRPRWLLKTTYFWYQRFPAGREVVVEHRYKPSVGIVASTAISQASVAAKSPDLDGLRRRHCANEAFFKAVIAAQKKIGPETWLMEKRLDYRLRPGANWGMPIGTFRLVIDKGNPDALLSVCAEDLTQTSPTRYELTRKDYAPESDLAVVILDKPATP